jgi:hypothetical protein
LASTPPWLGEPVESVSVVGADDMQMRLDDDAFITDGTGAVTKSVTLRVGRAIIVMDAVLRTGSGNLLMSDAEFDTAIANAVIRARHSLDQPNN